MARPPPKKNKPSTIADFIRPAVDRKYRTRAEAAENIGIDESTLSKILFCSIPIVSKRVVEMLCDKFDLDNSEGILRLLLAQG